MQNDLGKCQNVIRERKREWSALHAIKDVHTKATRRHDDAGGVSLYWAERHQGRDAIEESP